MIEASRTAIPAGIQSQPSFRGQAHSVAASGITSQPLHLQNHQDPKATWHFSFKSLGIFLASFNALGGLLLGEKILRNWSKSVINASEQASARSWQQTVAKILNSSTVKHLKPLVIIMALTQLAPLALTSATQIFKKKLSPQDIWKPLHDQGVDGQGMIMGIVDSGLNVSPYLKKEQISVFDPREPGKEMAPNDPHGHGCAVGGILSQALPKSKIVGVSIYKQQKAQTKAFFKHYRTYLGEVIRGDKPLTRSGILGGMSAMIEDMASGVRINVDQGAQVINVSMGSDKNNVAGPIFLSGLAVAPAYAFTQALATLLPPIGGWKERKQALRTQAKQLQQSLQNWRTMTTQDTLTPEDKQQLAQIFKPWTEALDYAYAHNVPVVLAAGNSGPLPLSPPKKKSKSPSDNSGPRERLALINLFGLFPNKALISVGSTNSQGVISHFTSQWKPNHTPLLAGNGNGELTTYGKPDRSLLSKILFPLSGLLRREMLESPKGTSFASPDISATIGVMKAIQPDLSIEEIIQHLVQNTQPVKLGLIEARKVKNAFKTLKAPLQEEALKTLEKTRAGAGQVNRYGTINSLINDSLIKQARPHQAIR